MSNNCNSFQVLLNQIVLGPSVIAVVFAWNNLWQGKFLELPNKYKKDAFPTLLTGKEQFIVMFGMAFKVVLYFLRV